MKRLVATLLAVAWILGSGPRALILFAQPNNGEISGTAMVEGKPLAHMTVRLRNVDTGAIIATQTTNDKGEFKFTGLPPGNYVIELVTPRDRLLTISPPIGLAPGSMAVTGVTVSTSAAAAAAAGVGGGVAGAGAAGAGAGGAAGAGAAGAAAAAGGAFFTTTAGIITLTAIGAGIAGLIAVNVTASNSK